VGRLHGPSCLKNVALRTESTGEGCEGHGEKCLGARRQCAAGETVPAARSSACAWWCACVCVQFIPETQ